MDLEKRVDNLEQKVKELEMGLHDSLHEIKLDLQEIKSCVQNNNDTTGLEKQLVEKDVVRNTARIKKLEDNQAKFVWAIVLEVISLIFVVISANIK